MKFTGAIYINSQLIHRVESALHSPNPPTQEQQLEILSLIGLLAIKGRHLVHYDGTSEIQIAGTKTDLAINSLALQESIRPDTDWGPSIDICVDSWKNAVNAGSFQRVLENPPNVASNFPKPGSAEATADADLWTEVLNDDGNSDEKVNKLLNLKSLRGNKLLAGLFKYSLEAGPDSSGLNKLKAKWSNSTNEQKCILFSGLINSAFRPFLLTSMANSRGGVSFVSKSSLLAITELKHSILRHAHKLARRDAISEILKDADEAPQHDLILLAGLRVLLKANPRKGPDELIRAAEYAAKEDECLNSFFHTIVLRAASIEHENSTDLQEELKELILSLKYSGLIQSNTPMKNFIHAMHKNRFEMVAAAIGATAGIYGPLLGIGAAALGVPAAKVIKKSTPNARFPESCDIEAAGALIENLEKTMVDPNAIHSLFMEFWEKRATIFTGK